MPNAPSFLNRFARVLCGSTLFLLLAGAYVTSTGSSLSVPDWPLSFGQFFPEMTGGVFYEHGHRMVAGLVALMTAGFALVAQKVEKRPWVRRLAWIAVGAVLFQAVLGGVTVLLKLPPAVSISHAGLAQVFFAVTVSLVFVTSSSWHEEKGLGPSSASLNLKALSTATVAVLYVQILLGALTRHLGAGLSIPDFPLNLGRVIPPLENPLVVVHFLHRLGAYAATTLALVTVWKTMDRFPEVETVARPAAWMGAVVCVQFLLGIAVVLTRKQTAVASAHLMVGAALFGTAVWLALAVRRVWRQS